MPRAQSYPDNHQDFPGKNASWLLAHDHFDCPVWEQLSLPSRVWHPGVWEVRERRDIPTSIWNSFRPSGLQRWCVVIPQSFIYLFMFFLFSWNASPFNYFLILFWPCWSQRKENIPACPTHAGTRLPLSRQLQPHRAVAQHQQRQQRLHAGPGGGAWSRPTAAHWQRYRGCA